MKSGVFLKKQPFLDFVREIMLQSPCGKRKYAHQRYLTMVSYEDVLEFLNTNNRAYQSEAHFLLKHCSRKYFRVMKHKHIFSKVRS